MSYETPLLKWIDAIWLYRYTRNTFNAITDTYLTYIIRYLWKRRIPLVNFWRQTIVSFCDSTWLALTLFIYRNSHILNWFQLLIFAFLLYIGRYILAIDSTVAYHIGFDIRQFMRKRRYCVLVVSGIKFPHWNGM